MLKVKDKIFLVRLGGSKGQWLAGGIIGLAAAHHGVDAGQYLAGDRNDGHLELLASRAEPVEQIARGDFPRETVRAAMKSFNRVRPPAFHRRLSFAWW